MRIAEWLTIHTEDSQNGLTVAELIEHFRERTGCQDHKAELIRELSEYVIEPGIDPKTNRQLRFPVMLTTSDVVRWLELNATVVSEGSADNRERLGDLICRTSRIEPTLDNVNSVLIRLPADTFWQFKGFTFASWLAVNTKIVNDLTMGDPARKIAESFCRSQGLAYDAGTIEALSAELDRLHYTLGSQSYLKLANFIV